MQPALEVMLPESTPWARYALDQLLPLVGYPYRFVDEWRQPVLRIGYGDAEASNDLDIWIPHSQSEWTSAAIELVFDDELPILSVGEAPTEAIRGGSFTFDVVQATFELLSRNEEQGATDFRAHQSLLYELGLNTAPVVNTYAARLREAIETCLSNSDDSLDHVPLWDGAEFAVVLTHDLDHVFHYSLSIGAHYWKSAVRQNLSGRSRLEALSRGLRQVLGYVWAKLAAGTAMEHLERHLKLERQVGVRSTFFIGSSTEDWFLEEMQGRTAPNPLYRLSTEVPFCGERQTVAEVLSTLTAEGWEIGLHGSLSSHADAIQLREERVRLENTVGESVESVRQHYLQFSAPETWQVQHDAGLPYDSTLGYNDCLGHRAGIAAPFEPYNPEAERSFEMLELPLTVHDIVHIIKDPVSVNEAVVRTKRLLERVQAVNGLATLSWHPILQATQDWEHAFLIYERLLSWLADKDVRIGTVKQIGTAWEQRVQRLRLTGN